MIHYDLEVILGFHMLYQCIHALLCPSDRQAASMGGASAAVTWAFPWIAGRTDCWNKCCRSHSLYITLNLMIYIWIIWANTDNDNGNSNDNGNENHLHKGLGVRLSLVSIHPRMLKLVKTHCIPTRCPIHISTWIDISMGSIWENWQEKNLSNFMGKFIVSGFRIFPWSLWKLDWWEAMIYLS